jgi:hypothetical protein
VAPLPPLLGTLRRRRLLHEDPPAPDAGGATLWEAWDTADGARVLVRVPRTPAGPVGAALAVLRVPSPVLATTWVGGAWPHLRTAPIACTLADLLPLEEPADAAWIARLALGAFGALAALHATGAVHGWIGADSVVATRDRWTLAWLGPVGTATPADDIGALGRLVGELDPDGPVGALAASFADTPPPSATDATSLCLRACVGLLAREHHGLVLRARTLGDASRRGRLRPLARRLEAACPPPIVRGQVPVDPDEARLHVESDGVRIRAARLPGDDVSARLAEGSGFPVWGPAGLDPVAARSVLRAWATGRAGASPALAPLMRWLAATARLRVDLRLLGRSR